MAKATRKVLWALDIDTKSRGAALFGRAKAAKCTAVCVRSKSEHLPDLIGEAHAAGLEIYAWRWPAVDPVRSTTHYHATEEAAFVADILVPAGLDGYVVDPESDHAGDKNDWNSAAHTQLATDFCQTIRAAAAARGGAFRFGTTSGCTYPNAGGKPDIPWTAFVAASDVLLPQSYWRMRGERGKLIAINGGDPGTAVSRGLRAWKKIAGHVPVVPMAGELGSITAAEITAYGAVLTASGIDELHFYIDESGFDSEKVAAIAKL